MTALSMDPELKPPVSLRERLAQLIMVRIGSNLPPVVVADDDETRIAELIDACPIGGLLLFNGTKAGTPAALARLQARSKYPLLVASDIERGVGQQVRGYTLFPHAAALGRSAEGIAAFVDIATREAGEAGIHITFAPVADVNTNPRNPIISIRAFSGDPLQAAALTAAYVERAEQAGLLTTAKHFPGHGDTQQDSHDTLPVVMKSREELQLCELLPFQAAIDAGCSLVMPAHVAFPTIDKSGRPATLSTKLLQELLREEMGFEGVVCSDSLLMAGVRDLFKTEGEMALAVIQAGVDLLLDIKDPVLVVDYLEAGILQGTLSRERVHEAFGRVWKLKQKAFRRQSDVKMQPGELASRAAARIASNAIKIVISQAQTLPFDPEQQLVAILLKPFETAIDPPEQALAAALRERFRAVRYLELGPRADAAALESARQQALAAPQVVVAMIVRPAAWHAFGLLPQQTEFVRSLTAERPVIVASLGVSRVLEEYPESAVRICTHSDVAVSQQALADVLLAPPLAR